MCIVSRAAVSVRITGFVVVAFLTADVPVYSAAPATRPAASPPVVEKPPTPEQWAKVDEKMAGLIAERERLKKSLAWFTKELGPDSRGVAGRKKDIQVIGRAIQICGEDLDELFVLRDKKVPRNLKSPPLLSDLTQAKRIVLVIDARGPMTNVFATVKQLLCKEIIRFKPGVQSFNILFFNSEQILAVDEKELLPADRKSLNCATAAMEEVRVSGNGDPLPALRKAFEFRPDVIFFLAARNLEDERHMDPLIAEVSRLNVARKVRINTLAIAEDEVNGEASVELRHSMRAIAKESGGTHRMITPIQLEKEAGIKKD